MTLPTLLLTDDGRLTTDWPFVRSELERRTDGSFSVRHQKVEHGEREIDLSGVTALALFGGDPSIASLESGRLQVAGGETDRRGVTEIEWFWTHRIPFIDATPAWAQSVAELAIGLIICGLRQVPKWHAKVSAGWDEWTYPFAQFCDDDRFVNGTIAGKMIGVVGAGEIGGRVATWCVQLGATVRVFDPYVTAQRIAHFGATSATLDELVDRSDIVVVAVPSTSSAPDLIDAERVHALRTGAMVVTVTRTSAVNCEALRWRVLRDEIIWATDVYDVEPLPSGDPIRGRSNVVHTPHIAGRTHDANVEVGRLLGADFLDVVRGTHRPRHQLLPDAVELRLGVPSLKHRRRPT